MEGAAIYAPRRLSPPYECNYLKRHRIRHRTYPEFPDFRGAFEHRVRSDTRLGIQSHVMNVFIKMVLGEIETKVISGIVIDHTQPF
jgi:hypothetical protein